MSRTSYFPTSSLRSALSRGFLALAVAVSGAFAMPSAQAETVRILALGDSLTAGYGLAESEAFPARLEAALRAKGQDVAVINGGVSGDTSRGGLERLDWALEEGIDAVIVELGANDALRGIPPGETRANLEGILRKLKEKRVPALLAGMRAPPNLGKAYAQEFDRIFPDLAHQFEVEFYPFFLDGVAADRALNQDDGMHPNAKGAEKIAERMVEPVLELIGRLRD